VTHSPLTLDVELANLQKKMQHVRFEYLYRDEGNNKEYGEVFLANPNNISLEIIKRNIVEKLLEGKWFDPDYWGIPRFSFHRLSMFGVNDYLWYEFDKVTVTDDNQKGERTIDELLIQIEK
jgi:hypothetical protein